MWIRSGWNTEPKTQTFFNKEPKNRTMFEKVWEKVFSKYFEIVDLLVPALLPFNTNLPTGKIFWMEVSIDSPWVIERIYSRFPSVNWHTWWCLRYQSSCLVFVCTLDFGRCKGHIPNLVLLVAFVRLTWTFGSIVKGKIKVFFNISRHTPWWFFRFFHDCRLPTHL